MSPIESSVMVDSIGKGMMKEEERGEASILYRYKGEVIIPPLSLMDDTLCITEAGVKASLMNAHQNVYSASKGLQYAGDDKCKFMNVSKYKKPIRCQ